MANEITLYQNNSKTIIATISGLDTLEGYTPVLTAKDAIASTGNTFQITGETDSLTVTFEVLPAHTSGITGTYNYDVTLSNGINNYTAIQSKIIIKDSVRW